MSERAELLRVAQRGLEELMSRIVSAQASAKRAIDAAEVATACDPAMLAGVPVDLSCALIATRTALLQVEIERDAIGIQP